MRNNESFLLWLALTLGGAAALVAAIWSGFQGGWGFVGFAVLAMVLLAARDLLTRHHEEQQRNEAWADRAAQLGFEYEKESTFHPLGWPDVFALTREAFALQQTVEESSLLRGTLSLALPKTRHLLRKSEEGADIALFDYEFDKNDVTHRQATAAIASAHLPEETFALVPPGVWHKLTEGMRSTPAIHGHHRIISESASAAEIALELSDSLDPDLTLEVGRGFLLLYRANGRALEPVDVPWLLGEARDAYQRLCLAPAK